MENETIRAATHYFDNCRAAFRLLQGALLSGNYPTTDHEREELCNKFAGIEKRIGGDINDVKRFFVKMPPDKDYRKALETRSKFENKTVIVIDDKYQSAGWKETFEFIFGENAVKGFNTIEEFNYYIKNALPQEKRTIFSVFVDINFSQEDEMGRQGIDFINELSKRYPAYPLIAFSAYDSSVWIKEAFSYGAWDYFSKDPDERQSAASRTAVEYYQNFLKISEKFYKYHSDFSSIYNKINSLNPLLGSYRIGNKLYKAHILESIWMAYRYLILDTVIPFSPEFFKESKEDEIVFQITKAFESFLVCILQANNLIPNYKSNGNFGMGDLVDQLENVNSLKSKDAIWRKKIFNIVNKRNQNMHRYKVNPMKRKFITKPDSMNYNEAKILLDTALDKMIEILNKESGK